MNTSHDQVDFLMVRNSSKSVKSRLEKLQPGWVAYYNLEIDANELFSFCFAFNNRRYVGVNKTLRLVKKVQTIDRLIMIFLVRCATL